MNYDLKLIISNTNNMLSDYAIPVGKNTIITGVEEKKFYPIIGGSEQYYLTINNSKQSELDSFRGIKIDCKNPEKSKTIIVFKKSEEYEPVFYLVDPPTNGIEQTLISENPEKAFWGWSIDTRGTTAIYMRVTDDLKLSWTKADGTSYKKPTEYAPPMVDFFDNSQLNQLDIAKLFGYPIKIENFINSEDESINLSSMGLTGEDVERITEGLLNFSYSKNSEGSYSGKFTYLEDKVLENIAPEPTKNLLAIKNTHRDLYIHSFNNITYSSIESDDISTSDMNDIIVSNLGDFINTFDDSENSPKSETLYIFGVIPEAPDNENVTLCGSWLFDALPQGTFPYLTDTINTSLILVPSSKGAVWVKYSDYINSLGKEQSETASKIDLNTETESFGNNWFKVVFENDSILGVIAYYKTEDDKEDLKLKIQDFYNNYMESKELGTDSWKESGGENNSVIEKTSSLELTEFYPIGSTNDINETAKINQYVLGNESWNQLYIDSDGEKDYFKEIFGFPEISMPETPIFKKGCGLKFTSKESLCNMTDGGNEVVSIDMVDDLSMLVLPLPKGIWYYEGENTNIGFKKLIVFPRMLGINTPRKILSLLLREKVNWIDTFNS